MCGCVWQPQNCANELCKLSGLPTATGKAPASKSSKKSSGKGLKKAKKSKRDSDDDDSESDEGASDAEADATILVEEGVEIDELSDASVAIVHGSDAGGDEGVSAAQQNHVAPSRFHTLRCYVVQCLQKCFSNDSSQFMNKDRLEVLQPGLVSLYTLPLSEGSAAAASGSGKKKDKGSKKRRHDSSEAADEDEAAAASGSSAAVSVPGGLDGYTRFVGVYIVPVISQLAVAIGDCTIWKPLNYAVRCLAPRLALLGDRRSTLRVRVFVLQVLFFTRDKRSRVRLAALRTLLEFSNAAGEEFLSLLPETLPYLSEVMEDDNGEVVALCHSVIRRLEDLSGESMQEYLRS